MINDTTLAQRCRQGASTPSISPVKKAASARQRAAPICSTCPPYSPDFNPIENAFAKLKALLRKAAERTVRGPERPIGQLIDLGHPVRNAQNLFVAAGYDAD